MSLQMQVFDRLARILGALSAPARLRLLQVLAQGPRSVESLAKTTKLSVANTSMHLQKMAKEGLVKAERRGVTRIYSVASPAILAVWENVQDMTAEIDPWMRQTEREISDPMMRGPEKGREVLKALKKGKAVLLDVRPKEETSATPVPHSLALSHKDLFKSTRKFSKRKSLYILCRGRYCPQATEAVRFLRKKGFHAFRLRQSPYRLLQEWRGNR